MATERSELNEQHAAAKAFAAQHAVELARNIDEWMDTAILPKVCKLRELGEILEPSCGDSKLKVAEGYADRAIRTALVALAAPPAEPHPTPSASESATWRALLDFVTHRETEEAMEFLRAWKHGRFDVCRREWPEAPESVYPAKAAQPSSDGAT